MDDPTFNSFSPLGNTSRVIDLRNQAPRAKIPKLFDKIPKTVICHSPADIAASTEGNIEYVDEDAIQEQLSAKNKEAADVKL